ETVQPRSGARNGVCWNPGQRGACSIVQRYVVPSGAGGAYALSLYAKSDRAGAFIGVSVNAASAGSREVSIRRWGPESAATYGAPYRFTFSANPGDTVTVWGFSPNTPGWLVMDDVTLTR